MARLTSPSKRLIRWLVRNLAANRYSIHDVGHRLTVELARTQDALQEQEVKVKVEYNGKRRAEIRCHVVNYTYVQCFQHIWRYDIKSVSQHALVQSFA